MIESGTRNEKLVRDGYEAFARGDMATIQQQFDPNVVWHAQRLGILSGDHVGFPAVLKFFAETMELTQGTFRIDVEDVLANDKLSAAVVRVRASRGERKFEDRQVHLFHLENGRVLEIWQYVGDGQAAEAFWS